jgi:hypothetical protein
MIFYAQLNENNICVGVSQLSGPVDAPNMVQIDSVDMDKLWHKYENGQWSAEKYEPVSAAPLTDFQQLRADVDQLIISSLGV